MRFRGGDNRLQLDKWEDKIFAAAGYGGGIGAELDQSFFMAGIRESDVIWDGDDPLRVDGDEALWIWSHGNRHRDAIGTGPGSMLSPTDMAGRLQNLHRGSTGHIIVWTCFGGFPGGFTEHLARFMANSGYNHLHFWGAVGLTGHMQRSDDGNQWADVLVAREREGQAYDLARAAPPGRLARRLFATRDDLNGWGPGLMQPMFRVALTI